jgi:Zn-dependent M28 family amino/carboxypeptidase
VSRTHLTVALACAAMLVAAPAAMAASGGGNGKGHHGHHHGKKSDSKKLRQGVTLKGMLEHQRALQRIAIANGGNRAATTPGYDASVEYVAGKLRAAGYDVSFDGFDFPIWTKNGAATLAEVTPTPRTFVEDTDYIVSQFSGSGNLTANVVPVDAAPAPQGASTSGCEAADFTGFVAGSIALMLRGTCPFVQKYQNAKNAGAAAALIFNDGFPGRTDPLFITSPVNIGIPTIMTSSALGESLRTKAAAGPVTARVVVDATTTPNTEYNVIADSRWGDDDRTIVVGAHLDSVEAGPGINDNGSGTSSNLEMAEQIAKLRDKPRNRLRFAFWGAEEAGLVGSTAYVAEQVANGGIEDIEANLNFDMLASPNFVRFVYDGDGSTFPVPAGTPAGSAQIEHIFLRYFERKGLVTDPTAFDGRSDYGAFIANGVPAGGLFSGAEGIKTTEQEARYGGFAGLAFDPCYHQACDTFFNQSYESLDQMSDAAAHTAWTLARARTPIAATTKSKARAKKGKRMKYKGSFRVQ